MTQLDKEQLRNLKNILNTYANELAKFITNKLKSINQKINVSSNSNIYKFIVSLWLASYCYGYKLTLHHIAWAWWVLFLARQEDVCTFEEAMEDDNIAKLIKSKGKVYSSYVRNTYYYFKKAYPEIFDYIIKSTKAESKAESSEEDESKGQQILILEINEEFIVSLSEKILELSRRHVERYKDIKIAIDYITGKIQSIPKQDERKERLGIETIFDDESLIQNLVPFLLIIPDEWYEFSDISIEEPCIVWYLRSDPKLWSEMMDRLGRVAIPDENKIHKIYIKLFEDPQHTFKKILEFVYTSAAKYIENKVRGSTWSDILRSMAAKPFFILMDESRIPSKGTYYKILGFEKSPAPGTIDIIKDAVIVNYEPVSFEFAILYICEDGHVTVHFPDDKTKVTNCPICGKSIYDYIRVHLDGVRAEVMSTTEGDMQYPKDYILFVPKPLWDLISNLPSYSLLIVKIRDVGKANIPDKKPVYYPLIVYIPRYEEKFAGIEQEAFKYIASLPTWKILLLLQLLVYGKVRGSEHTIISTIFTAFSQGKQFIKLQEISSYETILGTEESMYEEVIAAPLNTLIVGPTSSGKSTIAKKTLDLAAPDVSRGLCYLTLVSASRAGLFLGVDRQAKSRIKLGVEPLNDGKIVVYDEADKIAKLNNKDEIISNFLSAMYDGRVLLTQIKKSERNTRVARIFVMNTEILKKEFFSDVLDIITTIVNGVPSTSGKTVIKVFGEETDQFLSRIDIIAYQNPLYAQQEIFKKVLKDIYQKYTKEILDTLEKLKAILGVSKRVDLMQKLKDVLHKYILFVRDALSLEQHFVVPYEVIRFLDMMLNDLYRRIQSKYGSVDYVPALKYIQIFAPDRRKESILKIARAIAHLHLRNYITKEDVTEALAFHLFIHTYPFILSYPDDKKKASLEVLSYFYQELSIYYELCEYIANTSTVQTVEVQVIQATSPSCLRITSEQALREYIISVVRELKNEVFTPYGVPIDDICARIYDDIINNRIQITSSSATCMKLRHLIEKIKLCDKDTAIRYLKNEISPIFEALAGLGEVIVNYKGGVMYINTVND